MILVYIIIVLLLGGLLSWVVNRWSSVAAKWIAFLAVLADFLLVVNIWLQKPVSLSMPNTNADSWLIDFQQSWIPQLGVSFHMSLDGLSLVMAALTLSIGALSVLFSWKGIKKRQGFYYFNTLWLLAGILGVFFSMDMLLFYFFWEIMLIPMFFLMAIWGFENKRYASIKFFLFTQISGLLMLLAILGLAYVHYNNTDRKSVV